MISQSHFKELLQLLEKNNVEYVLVGGYAVAFHGFPRFTKDLDVFFRISEDNVAKIKKALIEFGFPEEGTIPHDSSENDAHPISPAIFFKSYLIN